ncbi:MAG: hypothetical protein IJ723_02345 [Ruminococcus sp.]|nr:hypothetical protein [Ruminococcus sp.]
MPGRNIYRLPRYIAHRGLHDRFGRVPENSMAAFRAALENGFAIELDVRFTADRRLVVFHDRDLMRMCGAQVELKDLTYEQLSRYTLHASGERIPLLADVLRLVHGRVFLLIELKDCPEVPDAEKRLAHMLRQYAGEYAVQSFDPRSLMKLRLTAPEIMRGQLVSFAEGSTKLIREIAATMPVWKGVSKPDFLAWDLRSVSIDSAFSAAEIGAKLITWTADSEELLKSAETFSDSVIFENIPAEYFKDI